MYITQPTPIAVPVHMLFPVTARQTPLRKSQKHSGYRYMDGCWLLYIIQPMPIAVPVVRMPFPVTARQKPLRKSQKHSGYRYTR